MNAEIYLEWFTKKNLATGTQEIYRIVMEDYQKFTGKSLEQLIEEAEKDEESQSRIRKREINKHIFGYKNYLEKKGYAPGTINNKMAAIISFYKSFDINVPTLTLNKGDTILDKNDTPLITKEQLNKMLNVASARDKAIIYLLALSGMSQKEARDLTIKKYIDTVSQSIQKDILDIEWLFQYEELILEEVLMINLTRDKAKFRRQTFIPPEVNRAIITYLKERKFNRNEKKHITDLNNALFVTNDGNPMSRSGITTAIRRVGEKAGFISEKGAHCYWKPHGCRKYVESTIINYNGDRILADYILGHKIDNVTRAYWKADPEQLKKRYLKVLPQLSLDGIKVKDYESKEYKQLVKDSVEKDKKISRMEQRMEIVEALLNDKGFVKELNDQ